MNILITSGGTTEKIDNVRGISNNSTGRLGAAIAAAFATQNAVCKIFYVSNKATARPSANKTDFIFIESVDNLSAAIADICSKHPIDIIIHAMAVSDYKVTAVSNPHDVADAADLAAAIKDTNLQKDGKISSNHDNLIMLLQRTPKIIATLRQHAPNAVIVGFKLLDNVPRGTLIAAAKKLLEDNNCDFVLANDLSQISSKGHVGYLINRCGDFEIFDTKDKIADGIVGATIRRMT